jgi:hypothetical protein
VRGGTNYTVRLSTVAVLPSNSILGGGGVGGVGTVSLYFEVWGIPLRLGMVKAAAHQDECSVVTIPATSVWVVVAKRVLCCSVDWLLCCTFLCDSRVYVVRKSVCRVQDVTRGGRAVFCRSGCIRMTYRMRATHMTLA